MSEEAEAKLIAALTEMFGDRLADPEVHPRQYEYHLKLLIFELQNKKDENGSTVPATAT